MTSNKFKIGIVTSRFNKNITESLKAGAIKGLTETGLSKEDIIEIDVPGAVEIPMACKWLISEKKVAGVVALGAVVKGDTYHFESVCNLVEKGCMDLQLLSDCPISFGVLMTYTEDQALARCGGQEGNKGQEAAEVLVEMLALKKSLKG